MKVLNTIGICLLLLIASSFAVEIGADVDTVRILSVSTALDQDNAERKGSIQGGTRLFIKIVGHDAHIASNNEIFVGPYKCEIPEMGVNEIFITCITTPALDPTKTWQLPVVVKTVERSDSQCAQSDASLCTFTYDGAKTPILDVIVPRTVVSDQNIYWWGNFRVFNTNQIQKMLIGSLLCDRFHLGLNEDSEFSGNSYNSLECQIHSEHPAGFYQSQFLSNPGKAINRSRLTTVRSTTLNAPYDIQVSSSQTGQRQKQKITSQGGIVRISATGIPSNGENVTFEFAGKQGSIYTNEEGEVEVRLPSGIKNLPVEQDKLQYVSGSGVRLQIYKTGSWDINSLIEQYKSKKFGDLTLLDDNIVPSTEYGITTEEEGLGKKFLVFTGYFNPPRDGSYQFQTSSSYSSKVLFQTTGSSTDESTMTLINDIIEGTEIRSPYSNKFDNQQSTSDKIRLDLQQGKAYYFKIYSLSSNEQNFYHSTGVRIPTGNTQQYVNSVNQITRIKIDYDFTKEVISIQHKDKSASNKSNFYIHFIDPFGTKLKDDAKVWSITNTKFSKDSECSSISNHFKQYNDVKSSCKYTDLNDANGKKIGRVWELTFETHRRIIRPTFAIDSQLAEAPVYTQVRAPGAELSGTFRLKVNGSYVQINKSSDIPFNVNDWDLSWSIQQILGTNDIDSSRVYNFIDGAHWVFDFYGIASPIFIESVESESKLGGEPGKAKLVVETLREASNQLYYAAIENELLTQQDSQPHLLARVNGVLTLASTKTEQTVINVVNDSDAFQYSDFTDDEVKQIITINGITSNQISNILPSNFIVFYNGIETDQVSFSSGTLKVQYPYKVAGSYKPEVHYFQNGFALTSSPNKLTVPAISSLSSTTIYSFGGSEITISGKYFPLEISSDLIVKIGSQQATILQVSNTSITIRTPGNIPAGNQNLVVIYQNQESTPSSITVNDSGAITLTQIDKTIVSPVEKTLIQVTGTNFGSDKSALAAFLDEVDSNGKTLTIAKYKVNVVKAENTSVNILLGGGVSGMYRLRVVQIGKGSNNPSGAFDRIQYDIQVDSFSRTNSSRYGGAKLVITGQNFSKTPADNQVLVVYSPVDSEFCIITSASTTQLECTLPNMSSHFPQKSTSVSFDIEVWGKLIAKASFKPNLVSKITFSDSQALTINSVCNNWQLFDSDCEIIGKNIPTNTGDVKVVIIGYDNVVVTIKSVSSTSVKYIVPNLPAGKYKIALRTVDGDSNPLDFNLQEFVVKQTDYNISAAGQEITIKTSGSLPDQDPIFKFNDIAVQVLSYNNVNGLVKIRLPSTTAGNGYKLLSARSSRLPLDKSGNIPWIAHPNTYTVLAASWSVSSIQVTGTDVTITGTNINALVSAYLQDSTSPKSTQYTSTSIESKTPTQAKIKFDNIVAGTYKLFLLDAKNAYPTIQDSTVQIDLPTLTVAGVTSSYAGGQLLTITHSDGSNFNSENKSSNVVVICGNQASVVSVNSSTLIVQTPPVFTKDSIQNYSFPSDQYNPLDGFTTFGNDAKGGSDYLGDGDLLFYYSSSIAGECSAGLDFGSSLIILSKFELFPRSQGVTDASAFFGAKFQASNDKNNWVDLIEIGTDFHLGKNMYLSDTLYKLNSDIKYKQAYRYFRIYDQKGTSKCELVEIKLYGWKSSSVVESGNILTCPISVQVNKSKLKSTGSNVIYDKTKTYMIKEVNPSYGDISGGTDITIKLDRTINGVVSVKIDDILCTNIQTNGDSITCKTDKKDNSNPSSLVVTVESLQAVNNGILFYYGNLWSLDTTWGNDFSPIDGDLVFVNNGKTLIVDVPYIGVLNTVIVDNATLLFANNKDIHFEANNILVRHGKVIIGTEVAPITGKVRITMHGKQEDKQFPTVGNKGLSVHNGSIDIHGKKRSVTWTELYQTAEAGAIEIIVKIKDAGFDWVAGEEIVIASTDFSHGHAERRIIKSINKQSDKVIITLNEKLLSKHVGISEIYNGKTIEMRAEVGLLSRNVIYEGDESSVQKSYGAHMMLHGAHTSARIRYAEFTRTGQPKIIGRYPIHFHMVGDVSGSIVEGNAIHDSFARVLTIHATHYLQVKNNVGYNCAGHNIFLEDGIETNNLIEENLIIGTRQVWSMLQSDITAASFWITNPLNKVYNNRAAGGDFYGFWYEIKEKPDGPSARDDICPQGMGLGGFSGNKAHSYDRFGLRIFVLTNLKYPCQPHRNDMNPNPFEENPSFEVKFENFVSYKNHEDGVLAEEVGNMIFDNFALIDNKQSGFNVYLTNRTDEEVVLRNSIIVGKSLGNAAQDSDLINTRGIITPRTDGFKVSNVHFENYAKNMTVFKSCSFCFHFKKWVQGGKLTRFEKISYSNISSNKMFWENWRREIYEDMDGTLTGLGGKKWVTPSGMHLKNQPECQTTQEQNTDWDNGVICTRQVVRIEFSNPEKLEELRTKALYVLPTDNNGVPIQNDPKKQDESDFYKSQTVKIKNHGHDLLQGFVGTFLTGKIFSVQWELTAIDFTHMSVQLSPYHTGHSAEDTIVLRFPYTDYRETFEIGQMIAKKNNIYYKNVTDNQSAGPLTKLKSRSCKHGDWYNDITEKAMYLCLNDDSRPKASTNQYLERTDVNALKCKKNCPLPPGKCLKDNIPRKLSDISTWQNKLEDGITYNPLNSEELLIPCPWEVLVDKDITSFKKIIVQGTLRIDPTKDINISAYGIFIKGGTIIAEGDTQGSAYTKKLNFELLGERKTDTQFVIDDTVEVGNKVIVNTGSFILRGQPPSSTAARLTAPLNAGQNTITVSSAAGWAVGDRIAIAPTQLSGSENEEFVIQLINGNTITLNNNAQYYHFGASGITLTEKWDSYTQNLDLRAQVLHLSRNIKIKGQQVSNNIQWGCRVLNFYWKIVADKDGNPLEADKQLHLRGTLDWNGVEMEYCGQADTVRGALDFQKCGADKEKIVSLVKNTAIHNCPGYCGNIEESEYLRIENTNFYNGRPILLRIFNVKNIAVTGNHFVAARKRDYPYDISGMFYDMNAAIYFYSVQDIIADNILVSNNEVQGSEGPCVVLPHLSCDAADNQKQTVGIFGNQASTCLIGAMFKVTVEGCQWAGRIGVARSIKGIMVNPTRPGIVVQNVLAAESNRSVILRFAHEGIKNTGKFIDSAVYAVAVTDSIDAYNTPQKAEVCRNSFGTQNLVVTRGGEDFPLKIMPLAFDVICNSEVFDASLYQVNVKYVRFQKNYTNPNLEKCGNNQMMVTHPSASDATAGTYNTNVSCVDCNEEAYFQFMSPNPSWNGWFGGCGLFLCTGPENVLNVDFTGSLFKGKPSTAISHNDGIKLPKCKLQPNWNKAYSCEGTDYVQLEWESRAPDFNTRSHAPIMMTSLDGTYTNKINMFREWVWDGNEPMNKRENRFVATAVANQVYKVEYNGLNPYNIIHKIQSRTLNDQGEPDTWVIFVVTYQIPMNIEVSIDGGDIIPSYLVSENVDLTKKANICGANIYDWQTRTVQYVINGSSDCVVRAIVLDTVRIHVKVVLKVSEFFNDETKTTFISKVASFLQINDYSRIKIVGTNTQGGRFLSDGNNSPQFELIIDITQKTIDDTKRDPSAIYKDLTQKAESLKSALDSNSVPGLNPNTYFITKTDVLVASNTAGDIFGKNKDDQNKPIIEESSSESDQTLAIILGVVIGLVVISIAIVAFCAYKRYQQRKAMLSIQQAEIDHSVDHHRQNKEVAKVHPLALDPSADVLHEKGDQSSAPFQS